MNEPEKHYPDAPVRPGDWFLMDRCEREKFYVVEVCCRIAHLSRPGWMVNDGFWLNEPEFKEQSLAYLGRGKKKWYWRFLPWRNLVCPYYYPKQNA